MSRFYGTVQGSRGQATRCGDTAHGLVTEAAGWGGCIEVMVYDRDEDEDGFVVSMTPWHGKGDKVRIASGIIGDSVSVALGKDVFSGQVKRNKAARDLELGGAEEATDDWDEYEKTG